MSAFQGDVYTGRIVPIVGTLEIVRIIEVSAFQGCPQGEVPLYNLTPGVPSSHSEERPPLAGFPSPATRQWRVDNSLALPVWLIFDSVCMPAGGMQLFYR